jgi:molybdate-binding protein
MALPARCARPLADVGFGRGAGVDADARAAVIGGSHDPLLEWVVHESGCGLALLSEGSESGLARLSRDEIAMASVHFHGDDAKDDHDANPTAVRSQQGLHDAVVIAFARRSQGLLLAQGNPLAITDVANAVAKDACFGMRQPGAGAHMLLRQVLARAGLTPERLPRISGPYATGQELALAIRAGRADCGIASQSVAASHGLEFQPLAWERFDLALRRRTYFEPGPQILFSAMRAPSFASRAVEFGGYDVADAGTVRFNT